MADMDTYDNEPRTYDGMDYTNTYALYHNRRIRSYGDLVECNNSRSDQWSRASEGEFNINPHYGFSNMRRPCSKTATNIQAEYPRGGDRSRSRSPGADRDGDTRIRDDSYSGRGER